MDEIGNMSLTMQVKLYRVLQEGKVRPMGSTEENNVDVRVIAATNKDFAKKSQKAVSVKTFIIASALFLFICRRCASAAKTFPYWCARSWIATPNP